MNSIKKRIDVNTILVSSMNSIRKVNEIKKIKKMCWQICSKKWTKKKKNKEEVSFWSKKMKREEEKQKLYLGTIEISLIYTL